MKIILREDVRNIGKKFDVKEVSDGLRPELSFPERPCRAGHGRRAQKIGSDEGGA